MSKTKKADYKPSEAEKANASVAVSRNQRFKSLYGDLLLQMRDKTQSEDPVNIARTRANADVAQALTKKPSLRAVNNPDQASTVAQAYQGQLGQATAKGNEIMNKRQSGVLAVANKQEADTTAGMSLISRLGTSEALARAKADTLVDTAKSQALGEVGGAATLYGLQKGGFLS